MKNNWAKYYQMKLQTKYILRLLNQSRWRSVERSSSVIETSSMIYEEIRPQSKRYQIHGKRFH